MDLQKTIEELLSAPGVTGAEDGAAAAAERLLSAYCRTRRDTLGSVIGELDGDGDGILLDAHLDRIGLFVTAVTDDGFVKVSKCGGADIRTLACHEVMIYGREPVYGVVVSTPPHLLPKEGGVPKWETVAIDVGLPGEKAKALIAPGDRVQLLGAPRKLLGRRISAAALDDTAGIAVLLRTLDILRSRNVRRKLTVVFSVQEEITGGGAIGAAFASDDAAAIAVDVSFAAAPGIPESETKPMGSGVMIGASPCLTHAVTQRLTLLAKENGIPYTIEPMGGKTGTNAEDYAFAKGGRKAGLLSVPIRNMHTSVEVCDLGDLEAAANLLALFIEKEGMTA